MRKGLGGDDTLPWVQPDEQVCVEKGVGEEVRSIDSSGISLR